MKNEEILEYIIEECHMILSDNLDLDDMIRMWEDSDEPSVRAGCDPALQYEEESRMQDRVERLKELVGKLDDYA